MDVPGNIRRTRAIYADVAAAEKIEAFLFASTDAEIKYCQWRWRIRFRKQDLGEQHCRPQILRGYQGSVIQRGGSADVKRFKRRRQVAVAPNERYCHRLRADRRKIERDRDGNRKATTNTAERAVLLPEIAFAIGARQQRVEPRFHRNYRASGAVSDSHAGTCR